MTDKDIHPALSDEELQKILDNYAEAALSSLESRVPPDLELRLNSTMSRLASGSRKRRFTVALSSAAAVAVILTSGIWFMARQPSLPSTLTASNAATESPDSSPAPAMASTTPTFEVASNKEKAETSTSASQKSTPLSGSQSHLASAAAPGATVRHSAARSLGTPALVYPMVAAENHSASTQNDSRSHADEKITLPSSAALALNLTLSGNVPDYRNTTLADRRKSGFHDPSIIATMLSIKESLEKVNAVFYEARHIASSLTEEVAGATNPFRSI